MSPTRLSLVCFPVRFPVNVLTNIEQFSVSSNESHVIVRWKE